MEFQMNNNNGGGDDDVQLKIGYEICSFYQITHWFNLREICF